jgi:hypothetical protein
MDSLTVVTLLSHYVGNYWAPTILSVGGTIAVALWRAFVHWANNKPTTWYWNPVTKKFFVKFVDRWLAKLFGRGVNDCNVKYEDTLTDEAKEELKKHLIKKYPILQIEIPKQDK